MGKIVLWAAGCSAIAVCPAHAHQDQSGDQTTQATSQGSLEEIIVTARRRDEALQRTPVSVISLSEKDLEARSVTNLRSLQNFVPNLTFAPSQNVGEASGNAFIRGIGQEDFSAGAEPGVGFYLDGVYFARTFGTIMNVTDVARIEVLRGPQGTLFGKNTIGGAINLTSVMPRPVRERRIGVILGNYQRIEARATANEPLSDKLFLRLSIGLVSRDGYVRRLPPPFPDGGSTIVERDRRSEGDDRNQAGRLQLRWLINDTLTADFSLDGSRKRSAQGATHVDAIAPGFGIFRTLNRLIGLGRLPGPEIDESFAPGDLLESYAGGRNFVKQDVWGASAVVSKSLGANTLKFIGAYRGQRSHIRTDLDGLYFNILESEPRAYQRQFTGELQLGGETGALAYTAGLFALTEKAKLRPPAGSIINEVLYRCGCFYPPDSLPVFENEQRDLTTRNLAAYAQATLKISDRLSVTAGARQTYEKKAIDGDVFRLDADLRLTDIILASGSNRDAWSSFTYRAGVEYQATPALMTYSSIAKGYKSGGFNPRGRSDLPNLGYHAFGPETALTYEVGLRSEWLDRRLRVNATLFHTVYRDIQLRRQTIIDGVATSLIENAARARIQGAEVEVMAAPVAGLTVSAAYGHLDPRFLDVGGVAGLSLASRFQRTPRHTFSTSFNYKLPLQPGTLELHADYSYRSKEQFQIAPSPFDQDGYGLLGARVTFRTRDDRWSVALFGTNLADRRYRTAGRGTLINQVGIAHSSVGMPRQVGLQATTKF